MTITTTALMGAGEARRITERIRVTAVTFAESRQRLIDLVQVAKDGQAHVALGYASWTGYLSEVLGEEPMRLTRDDRKEMVQLLAAEGMSTRAIAPIVGVSNKTVHQDLASEVLPKVTPEPPTIATADRVIVAEQRHVNIDSGEITEPPTITGMDGKQYTRPTKPAPRAEALPSQFSSAIVELNRVMTRLHKLQENNRFTANKNQIATLHGSDLARAISELQTLADALN